MAFESLNNMTKNCEILEISHKIVDLAIFCNSPEFCDLEEERSGKIGMYTEVPQPCKSRKFYNKREKLITAGLDFSEEHTKNLKICSCVQRDEC